VRSTLLAPVLWDETDSKHSTRQAGILIQLASPSPSPSTTAWCVAVPHEEVTSATPLTQSQLRANREYEAIKAALYQGGVTAETIELLIAGAGGSNARKDSGTVDDADYEPKDYVNEYAQPQPPTGFSNHTPDVQWRSNGPNTGNGAGFGRNPSWNRNGNLQPPHGQRKVSYGLSAPDDNMFDDDEGFGNGESSGPRDGTSPFGQNLRTLYFAGLSDRTTMRDLLSVIKGGKILSINMRGSGATVTLFDGAAEFLHWAKRNDIYLNGRRVSSLGSSWGENSADLSQIEVRWAERQFRLNGHVGDKVSTGATRNLLIHNALDKGHTERSIRDDMEHIHNLIIVDVTLRQGDALVCTNSVHNALYARTCMMSRSTYKGCRIEFVRDECDVPLPQRKITPQSAFAGAAPQKKPAPTLNRFNLLNMEGTEAGSDEENRTPSDEGSDDDETMDGHYPRGVNLNFLDS